MSNRSRESEPKNDHTKPHNSTLFHTILHFSRLQILLNTCILQWGTVMSLEDYNMENITHVRIDDRGFSVYISVCYDTMRLHAWKYDDYSIEWDSFTTLSDFTEWVQKPIQKVK